MPSIRALIPVITMLSLSLAACNESTDPADEDAETADLVLVGGKIVTVDDDLPEAEALAARDGKIVAVGTRADIEAMVGDDTRVVDLEGKLAVPGLIDAHAHFLSIGAARQMLDLRQAKSWQGIVDQVAEAVKTTPEGQWITGRGWHQDKWDSAPEPSIAGYPTHASLSAVSADHPVLLTHASGHAVFVNAKALELAGIDDSTADPDGGEILRDSNGKATGLLNEDADQLLYPARGDGVSDEVLRQRVKLATKECLSKGITGMHDAGSTFADIDLLRQAAADGDLGIRLWMMVGEENDVMADKLADYLTLQDDWLAVGGIKRYMDGALGSRGALLLEPYADQPQTSGLQTTPDDDLAGSAELAIEHGYQLCIHAIGDHGNRKVLDLYERMLGDLASDDRAGDDRRWRVEHVQHLDPADLPRFAELGVIASMQTVHATSDGPWVPERIGDQRASDGAYQWQSLIKSGVVVVNGTDAPVEDVDPIANFVSAVTRRMPNGDAFYPDQAMTREQALRATTLDAAYAAKQEASRGSLEVGKLADITVLSQDIMTIADDQLAATDVVMTIVGGDIAYQR